MSCTKDCILQKLKLHPFHAWFCHHHLPLNGQYLKIYAEETNLFQLLIGDSQKAVFYSSLRTGMPIVAPDQSPGVHLVYKGQFEHLVTGGY